jgi:dsDNA-specific endonuclease/ATPase MutS2
MTLMKRYCWLALLPLFVLPSSAHGQTGGRLRERARTFLVLRLTDALNLTDEKALQVSRIIQDSENQRRELRQQRGEVEKEVRGALQGGKVDGERAKQWLEKVNQIDEQLALLPEKAFQEVQKILTPEQQAKLILVRPEIQSQVRGALQRRLRERIESRTGTAPEP